MPKRARGQLNLPGLSELRIAGKTSPRKSRIPHKLPYDPTVTARLLPELEVAQERLVSGVRLLFPQNKDLQQYVLRQICRYIRRRLRAA